MKVMQIVSLSLVGVFALHCFSQPVYAGDGNSVATWTESNSGMEFIYVPGGCYQMGDVFNNMASYTKPMHEVCVNPFYLGKYEVTQEQWFKIMGENINQQIKKFGSSGEIYGAGDAYPMYYISWEDAQTFTQRLAEKSGKAFRLPTEAEWEFAARSGGKREKYAGSSDINSVAWYRDNSGGSAHPVGLKKPNGLGFYDMSGNVLEWTQDWYDSEYYSKSSRLNPQGPSIGHDKSHRGGSWQRISSDAYTGYRGCSSPGLHGGRAENGFRVLLPAGQLK